MSEIRKHYFLDEYCIIAPGRYRRPSDFTTDKENKITSNCVFCAGNEDRTPPADAAYRDGEILRDTQDKIVKGWNIRCIPNLYPALSPTPSETSHDMWKVEKGFGFHEVIVETPEHGSKVQDLPDEHINLLMRVYKDRCTHYDSKEGVEYASLFKNWGSRAGASLEHSHSQLIALPFLPPVLKREQDAIHSSDKCPYCKIVEEERGSQRLLYENRDFIAIAPYFSIALFEIWVLPKKHINHLAGLSEEMLASLADVVKYVLSRYEKRLGSPSYNYMFHQIFDDRKYHMNLRIQPAIAIIGGFEKNTGTYLNTISPEHAASCLKGEKD